MSNPVLIDTAGLQWLASQGAAFALPFGRTKSQFSKGWQNEPHTLEDAITHVRRNGNVGILVGKYSGNIIALDRDRDWCATVDMLGTAARTAKIERDNAGDRGKLLYRVRGELPRTTVWKPAGEKHPWAELLSTGRHALTAPSMFEGGHYVLRDTDLGIMEVTPDQLDRIWWMVTGEHLYEQKQTVNAEHNNDTVSSKEYIRQVKTAWSTLNVFSHFDKDTGGTKDDRGEKRLLGNGGLMINDWRWYCHADSVGGDEIDAWYYCRHGKALGRQDRKAFWNTVNEMADAAGIARPPTPAPRMYTNGHSKATASKTIDPETGEILDEPAPQAKKDFDPLRYRAEDGGILDAWLDTNGNKWLFSVGHDLWHFWNKTHWQEDKERLVFEEIFDLMDTMNRECSLVIKETPSKIKALVERYAKVDIDVPESGLKEIERMKTNAEIAKSLHKATKRSSGRIASVEIMARSKRRAETPRFNAMESMNLKNGTLDLRSLELLPHAPEDLFSYCLDYEYDPAADCPLFKKFVGDVLVHEGTTDTDENLVLLFQELLGYSLTTQTNHQVMVWMPGEGSNGKSVAISILKALLGPLATSIDFQTLGTSGNYDMAEIPGKRVLLSLESEKGGGIAEKHIKAIVSGDLIKTRPIYGSPIDFCSTAKIWWAMNDKPVIKDTTNAIWRRMKMIPFHRIFEEGTTADPYLLEKLLVELSGILNWAIEGLIRLTLNGRFTAAENAEIAKQTYKEQSNPVALWINTACVKTAHPATLQAGLYANFKDWCITNGERLISSKEFALDLKRLKIESKKRNTGAMYHLAIVDTHHRDGDN